MKGLGTDDNALVRIIVTRCEVDMVQIKQEFESQSKQSLAQFIAVFFCKKVFWLFQIFIKFFKDDTSGEYRKILLTLIGEGSVAKK